MIKIALCDDNPQVVNYYRTLLSDSAKESGSDVKITEYESGEQLLFMLSDHPNDVDIIYLDILMGKMNGVETARRLRELGCYAQIIFLTTSDEYVFEAFDVEPFYYIVKEDMTVRKFKEIFLKVRDSVRLKEGDYISITINGTKEKLRLDSILYFEVQNRVITIHMKDANISYYSRLEEVEALLTDKGFTRIHRSYLVNCYYINKLSRKSLTLSNGTELPVSEKYTQNVQQQFSKYLLKI
jgi:DNA-binding LytR/AlgR family response regulator